MVPGPGRGGQRKTAVTGGKGIASSFLTPTAAGRAGGGGAAAAQVPGCCTCGQLITDTVKALQCDCCQSSDVWKCSDCLGLRGDLYDVLMSGPASCLKWFCDGCEAAMVQKKELSVAESGDRVDTLLALVQRLIDKFDHIDAHLDGKTDVAVTSQLEIRLRTVEERASQLEERLLKNEEKLSRNEEKWLNRESEPVRQQRREEEEQVHTREEAVRRTEEEKDIEARKGNIIMYRVPEDKKLKTEERRKADRAFVEEMCQEVFGVSVSADEDIVKMFRLGALPEDDRVRPLLVSFKDTGKKEAVMSNLRKLKSNEGKFSEIGVSHDLTPRQRKAVQVLLEEARKEQQTANGEDKENYKFIVVGGNSKPRVVRIKKQRKQTEDSQESLDEH
jgi:hypothetical protein